MAQLVEHILGKDEVPSSNLGSSSKKRSNPFGLLFFVSWSCYPIRIRISRNARNPVRIRHPKIAKLAWQAKGARIFASRIPGFYQPPIRVAFFRFLELLPDSNSVFSPREKTSSHSPPEAPGACSRGAGCANLRFCEYLGFPYLPPIRVVFCF